MADKENGTPWQAWAGVSIAVALIGAYATINANRPQPSEPNPFKPTHEQPAPGPEPKKDLLDLYEPQLKNAVDLASTAEIQAARELNVDPLYQIFKGTALKLQ